MKINVTENKVSIKEEQILNENEYNIHKIQFDFSSEYTDDLVKVALFSMDNHTYKKIISNNECDIPPEVLTQRGYSILGVYAYKTEQDSLVLRYSPSPTKISVYDGSYKAEAENSEPITPSEIEQYQQILQNSLQQFQNQYNALVEETEGDIQAIEDELQRKVDEGYFDGEDGFSPIAKVIQKSNGATIEIEDKNGKTTADVLNGEDGYTPVRGIDYWTEEDKQEVEEEATQQIEGKIEEYNTNAQNKLNQYNSNATQKTTDYNTNAEQKMSAYNTNATEKFNNYNSNAEQKETNYNTNASQKVESFNTNASSKLSEYNSNAETKKSAYDENATQKTNSFNTNATNKLTEYNTNHTEKMSAYNSNSTQKLNAFNENATQKTEDFDEHTEEIQDNIEKLQTENARLKATLPTTTGEGQDITLNKTAELEFKKPPLPMGNSEQESTTGKNLASDVYSEYSLSPGPYGFKKMIENFTQTYLVANLIDKDTTIDMSGVYLGFTANGYNYNDGVTWLIKDGVKQSDYYTNNKPYLSFYPTNETTFNKIFNRYKIQIELSNTTTPSSYEPYTGGTASPNPDYPQEITNVTGDVEVVVQNKNLLNISQLDVTVQGMRFKGNEDNELIISGTYTGSAGYISFPYKNISLPTGTYTFTAQTNNIPAGVSLRLWTTPTNLNLLNNNHATTTQMLTGYTFALIGITNNTTYNIAFKIQLEKGENATNVIPSHDQTFTFPLGNEKLMLGDYLADDGIHHKMGEIVFDGVTEGRKVTAIQDYLGLHFCMVTKLQRVGINGYNNLKCTHFIGREYTSNCIYVTGAGGTIVFVMPNQSINTPAKANDWLAEQYANSIPLIVQYELAKEIIVPYTSAQQEVYNQIKEAISYEEQTNISSNQIALFSVEAYQDAKVILAEKGTYSKPSTGIPKTDLASSVQTSLNKADTALQSHQDISGKQDITDNTLTTINKTVPTAINEVNSIAKLANQAKSYSTYQAFINYLNTAEKTEFIPGQSFMIQTKLVPDLWVYSVENTSVQYTYTTDEDFITYTNQATGGQVGYYKLAQLETQKVDLTDYATKTYVNNLFNSIVDGDEVSY